MKSLEVVKVSLSAFALFMLLLGASSLVDLSSVIHVTTAAASAASAAPPTLGNTSSSTNNTAASTNATTINIMPRVNIPDKPFAVGHYKANPINMSQTQVQFVFEGNTTITSENSTEMIRTMDTGQGNVTFLPGGANIIRGQISMTTEDGTENATGYFAEFMKGEAPTGIGVASFSTNSTETLEPLNNKMAVFLDDTQPNGDSVVNFFEWKSADSSKGGAPPLSNENATNTSGGV